MTDNVYLRLCSRSVWVHPSSGRIQGKLRTNQPQLTPAHPSSGRRIKREFRVPRFVAGNQAVSSKPTSPFGFQRGGASLQIPFSKCIQGRECVTVWGVCRRPRALAVFNHPALGEGCVWGRSWWCCWLSGGVHQCEGRGYSG